MIRCTEESTLFSVQFTVYSVHCTLYRTPYGVRRTLYQEICMVVYSLRMWIEQYIFAFCKIVKLYMIHIYIYIYLYILQFLYIVLNVYTLYH